MNNSRYQAIIFDLFGTLVDFSPRQYDDVVSAIAAVLAAPRNPFLAALGRAYKQQELGTDIMATLQAVCADIRVPFSQPLFDQAAVLWWDFQRDLLCPRPATMPLLRQLQDCGVQTGIVSNCPVEVAALWGETPMAPLIDVTIFSSVVKLTKPDPRIYELACTRLGISPRDSLYVGDGGSRELSGARAAGMTAVLLKLPDEDPLDAAALQREVWNGHSIDTLAAMLNILNGGPCRAFSESAEHGEPGAGSVETDIAALRSVPFGSPQ